MMISLTPLKLLNLAQLALISRLLFNKDPSVEFPKEAIEKMSHQKGKGNVMIFLGKHTIQMPPEWSEKSGHVSTKVSANQTSSSRTDWQNYVNGKSLPRPSRYLNRSLIHSVRTTKLSPFGEDTEHNSKKIARSQETNAQNIFYLPYLTRHNKIQFFDFDRTLMSPNNSIASPDEQGSTNQQMWPLLSRLLQGKSPPNQSPEMDKLTDGEKLVGKWIQNVLQRQLQSSDTSKEDNNKKIVDNQRMVHS